MLKSLPAQLILSIVVSFFLGSILNLNSIRFFYTLSTLFVDVILFLLPFMVFSFIFRAIINIERGSTSLILLVLGGVTLSNSFALFTAYIVGKTFLPYLGLEHCHGFAEKFVSSITPLFTFSLPKTIGADKAMFLGIFLGILTSFLKENQPFKAQTRNVSVWLSNLITIFLQKYFIPLLPLYVFGFCLKLSYDDALLHLFKHYGNVFFLSLALIIVYILSLYFIATRFNVSATIKAIKRMIPAGLTGFSTMSSAATLPVTLQCTEENTKNRNFTDLIIPATSNIHMLGDDLTIVITALALLNICGNPIPDLTTFTLFTGAFCIAKLSCVGIPGASVLVVLPVLQQFLGFTPEMISVLTTIYILQDPFGTAANVMGNGGFALLVQKVFRRLTLPQHL